MGLIESDSIPSVPGTWRLIKLHCLQHTQEKHHTALGSSIHACAREVHSAGRQKHITGRCVTTEHPRGAGLTCLLQIICLYNLGVPLFQILYILNICSELPMLTKNLGIIFSNPRITSSEIVRLGSKSALQVNLMHTPVSELLIKVSP